MTSIDNIDQMPTREAQPGPITHVDVLIVGAGISGVCGAYYIRQNCPDQRFVILDSEETFGGTWWTHRFPGIRSDSDLHTFGYSFKPWVGPPIATAEEIRKYMGEVITENDLDQFIRYRHKIIRANWSSADNLWTVDAVQLDSGTAVRFSTHFLWMCQGYYRHNEGYTPKAGRAWPISMAPLRIPKTGPKTWTMRVKRWWSSAQARLPRRWCQQWLRPPVM